jgi:alpha-L-arabinofuranosidase
VATKLLTSIAKEGKCMMKFVRGLIGLVFSALVVFAATDAKAQSGLSIYTDNLVNGFQDWSFSATRNFSNPTPTNSGSHSVSVTITSGFGALSLQYPNGFNTTPYSSLVFWINGGVSGGQRLQVYGTISNNTQTVQALTKLETNTWQQFIIPLTALGIANKTNCSGIVIQGSINSSQPVFYVDDIQLVAAPAPAIVHLGVDAGQILRNVDARQFGVNTATWDGNLDTASTSNALQEMGVLALRFPGGSTSDQYHWATSKVNNTLEPTTFSNFIHVATNMSAQVFITVNYGSGTSNEAAAWVLAANVTNHCGFKYWEIGNECYGTWETDNNSLAHDPFTYANRAAGYIQLMKAADPTIKIGVVIVPGENNFSNNATHFAINPRTGIQNYGWTPIMLTTLKNLGITPDFAIYHFYPESTPTNWAPNSTESDPLLLQAAVNWKSDAADLRQQITDYFGPTGTNIELVCTENNSDSGAMGRQSTSIVNALYLADSTSQIMKTEFNSYIWWALHHSADTQGVFDPTRYGWRSNGD